MSHGTQFQPANETLELSDVICTFSHIHKSDISLPTKFYGDWGGIKSYMLLASNALYFSAISSFQCEYSEACVKEVGSGLAKDTDIERRRLVCKY